MLYEFILKKGKMVEINTKKELPPVVKKSTKSKYTFKEYPKEFLNEDFIKQWWTNLPLYTLNQKNKFSLSEKYFGSSVPIATLSQEDINRIYIEENLIS